MAHKRIETRSLYFEFYLLEGPNCEFTGKKKVDPQIALGNWSDKVIVLSQIKKKNKTGI